MAWTSGTAGGTVIRFLTPFGEHGTFNGVEFHADGPPTFYDEPRLGSAPPPVH